MNPLYMGFEGLLTDKKIPERPAFRMPADKPRLCFLMPHMANFNMIHHVRNTLRLTYESDRLPAISGIASVESQGLGASFLSGLWYNMLADELLWFATDCPAKRSGACRDGPFAAVDEGHV